MKTDLLRRCSVSDPKARHAGFVVYLESGLMQLREAELAVLSKYLRRYVKPVLTGLSNAIPPH